MHNVAWNTIKIVFILIVIYYEALKIKINIISSKYLNLFFYFKLKHYFFINFSLSILDLKIKLEKLFQSYTKWQRITNLTLANSIKIVQEAPVVYISNGHVNVALLIENYSNTRYIVCHTAFLETHYKLNSQILSDKKNENMKTLHSFQFQ